MKARKNWIFISFCWCLATALVWSHGLFQAHFASSHENVHLVKDLQFEIEKLKFEKAKVAYQFEDFRQNAALHWPEARKRDYRWPASVAVDLSSALYEKGRHLFQEKKWDQAASLFQELTKSYPYSKWIAEAHYYQCEIFFQVRDFKSAAGCAGEMAELFPENPLTGFQLIRLGQVHEIHGQLPEALEIYRLVGQQFQEPLLVRQARESVARLE